MSEILRVLNIINSLNFGGAETLLKEHLLSAKQREDCIIDVCVLFEGEKALIKELKDNGINVYELEGRRKYSPVYLPRLFRLIRAKQYNIVHAHLFPTFYYVGILSLAARSCRYFLTEHSVESRRDRYKIATIIDRLIYSRFEKIICVGEVVRNSLASKLPAYIEKMEVIHNAIPISKGYYPNNCYQDKTYDVINVGSMHSELKGQETILRAIAMSSINITAAFAGDGIMRKDYEELAAELNIGDRVKFLGTVYPIRDYLRQAKIFVLASSYEGLPIALLEAMSEGMPIVATDVGGVPELIINSITGLLIDPHNPTKLAEAVFELLRNEKAAVGMGNRARNKVERCFSIKQYTERIIAAYLREAKLSS